MRKITEVQIQEEIVQIYNRERIRHNNKIPQKVSELPHRHTLPSWKVEVKDKHGNLVHNEDGSIKLERIKNPFWRKAYTNIANRRRPKVLDLLDFKKTIDDKIVKKEFTRTPPKEFTRTPPKPPRVPPTPTNSITITIPSSMSYGKVMDVIAFIREKGIECKL